MKMKLFCFPAVIFPLVVMNSGLTLAERPTTTDALTTPWWWTTTGLPGFNLNGKMFTLSAERGSISFYPPYYSSPTSPPWPATTPYTTSQPTSYPYWTTAPPTRGVSVCLRYIADYPSFNPPMIFTLSPSRTPLKLQLSDSGASYTATFGEYSNALSLRPNIRFWPNIGQDIWNRVCVTVDSVKKVSQMFSGFNMSIRKKLPFQYVWSGEPLIEFPGFDGQVTDVQVWDYPLGYREILNYMTSSFYGPHYGSILTWSSIRYSPRGNTLMEDVYEWQAKQPISSKGRGRRPKGEKKKTRERKRQL